MSCLISIKELWGLVVTKGEHLRYFEQVGVIRKKTEEVVVVWREKL